jgi:hypothetical protein
MSLLECWGEAKDIYSYTHQPIRAIAELGHTALTWMLRIEPDPTRMYDAIQPPIGAPVYDIELPSIAHERRAKYEFIQSSFSKTPDWEI